jgi:glycosyltransferase involved in cell wall biosynthesis
MDMSIIIPAHNESDYIGRTLDSLKVYAGLEVVVVADDCRDATSVIARRAGVRVEQVAYGNAAQAKNRGFEVLEGRGNVMFLDADTTVPPDLLYPIDRIMHCNGVSGKVAVEPDNQSKGANAYYNWVNFCSWLSQHTTKVHSSLTNGAGACMFGSYDVLDEIRTEREYLFDPTVEMFEDQELIAQLHKKGRFDFVNIPGLRVTTSTRRFDQEGFWGRFLKDWVQLAGFKKERLNVR